jgi:hypothetical protein
MKILNVKILLLTVSILFVTVGKADTLSEQAINSAVDSNKRPLADIIKIIIGNLKKS